MFRHAPLAVLGFAMLCCTTALAQGPCSISVSTNSNKLACAIPYIYGINGLSTNGPLNPKADTIGLNHQDHFDQSEFRSLFPAASSAVGSQLTFLPLASPSSGFLFVFDKSLGVSVPSDASYGPILGERAETIGKHRLFVAFSYQFFNFDSIDGMSLQNIPAAFTHEDTPRMDGSGVTCSASPGSMTNRGPCAFVRDVMTTRNGLSLKVNQFTMFATFGLTRRIDVSVAAPIVNARMKVNSVATIQNISQSNVHFFLDTRTGCTGSCLTASFSNANSATGIGDVTFRVKGTVWPGERLGVAAGVDVRAPTGDDLNFLGSGAAGVRPFAIVSYRARISPHASVGYEWNGSSILAGDVILGTKARLPNRFTYTAGADVLLIAKRLSGSFDIIGLRAINAQRVSTSTFVPLTTCQPSTPPLCADSNRNPSNTFADISTVRKSYNSTSASIGLKFRPVGRLLITANVLVRLDDGGLRAKPVPLVGASYTF